MVTQPEVESEFKPKSYFVILRSKVTGTCARLPAKFVPYAADLGLLRVPMRNAVTNSVTTGDQEHRLSTHLQPKQFSFSLLYTWSFLISSE